MAWYLVKRTDNFTLTFRRRLSSLYLQNRQHHYYRWYGI